MKARREQGTVLKSDITRYELQREQLNLQKARASAHDALPTISL